MTLKSKRQRQTRQRQTRRRRKVRIVVGGGTHPELEEALKTYLRNLSKPVEGLVNDTECITPKSKGGQQISICEKYVYKTPPSTELEIISEGENVIRVDPYTMNLLIQSVVQTFPDLTDKVETYIGLDGTGLRRRLIGEKYSLKYDGKNCFSVEDYIKTYNGVRIRIQETNNQAINMFIEQLTEWIKSIVETLDILWEKIQFHHCDPKAAQLFITETDGVKRVIVGDLDRVTFSMNIDGKLGKLVRVCSPNFSITKAVMTKGSSLGYNSTEPQYSITLESATPPPQAQAQSMMSGSFSKIFSRSRSPAKTVIGGTSHTVSSMEQSFAEKMRSLTKPNANNHLEIAAFISSILLLIDNPQTKQDLYKNLNSNSELKKYMDLIDFEDLKQNTMDFKGRSSHKTACHYVNNMGNSDFLKSDFHIPDATPPQVVATPSQVVATPTQAQAQVDNFVDL
jgi:hypothetical protein